MRVLHITPWFPHDDDPSRTVFIQRHIGSLDTLVPQHVLHMDMDNREYTDQSSDYITIARVNPFLNSWRWKEWVFYRELKKQLIRLNARNEFSHVVFHIAYPALVYLDKLRPFLPPKVAVVEHWSIYHYNFYSSRKPHRLSRIFHPDILVLAVSETLKNDLLRFTGRALNISILPNVVEVQRFRYLEKRVGQHYFMAALWKNPKNPIDLLRSLTEPGNGAQSIQLRIAGEGPLLTEMKQWVEEHALNEQVQFLGRLNPDQMADELNAAKGLILPTRYETFSVITAEALCCGCPVIADNVGALPELLHDSNGILRDSHTSWRNAIQLFETKSWNRAEIAAQAMAKFCPEIIGQRYLRFLQEIG